jgi:ABC-type oligopeptide transport system ATPase subunit
VSLLALEDVRVHFELRSPRALVRAVDGVSFELERGQALGLVGESGSGKTTVARAILGLEPVSSGRIRFDGLELATLSSRERRQLARRIGVVFQDPYASLDPRQRVSAIVAEPLAIHGLGTRRERTARVSELLEAVGLRPEHAQLLPHEFSGGQRQRIAIARALAARPELLVCDEPTSALDVSVQAQIVNLLSELGQRTGVALLFISHDLAVVRRLCDRVAVLYLGQLVELAPREELFANPRHPYTRALLAAVPSLEPKVPVG